MIVRLSILQDAYDLALSVADAVWPTPEMALANLFERGVSLLEAGGDLPPLRGSAPAAALASLNMARDELFVLETRYIFTNYATYRLTGESEALEATWVALADEHLALRSEIVGARREEERLKRELKALGAHILALPEHEELPESTRDRPRKGRAMYSTLFDGLLPVGLNLDLDPDIVRRGDRIVQREGWAAEWGDYARLVILAHGLSLALRDREADRSDADSVDSVELLHSETRQRMMGLQGRYATLRYRIFELRRNVQILGWRITALKVEANGMRARLDLFNRDRERLATDLAERCARMPATPTEEPKASSGWRTIFSKLLGRSP